MGENPYPERTLTDRKGCETCARYAFTRQGDEGEGNTLTSRFRIDSTYLSEDKQHEGDGSTFSSYLQKEGFFASPSPKLEDGRKDNLFIYDLNWETRIPPFNADFDGSPSFLFKANPYYPERNNFVCVYPPLLESIARPILYLLYYIILYVYYREMPYISFLGYTHTQSCNPSGQNGSGLNNNRRSSET